MSEHTKGGLWFLPAAALLLLAVACGLLTWLLVRSVGGGGSGLALLLLNLALCVAASVPLIAILRRTA